jgi:hypothetical protein
VPARLAHLFDPVLAVVGCLNLHATYCTGNIGDALTASNYLEKPPLTVMIKLNAFLMAQYAAVSTDNQLTIAGTVDNLDFTLRPDRPADAEVRVPLRSVYIVFSTEASIIGGLTRHFRMRVVNGNGEQVHDEYSIDVNYALNPQGRPMRNHCIIKIASLPFPGPDDYVFELRVDGQDGVLGELNFTVTDRTVPPGNA